MHKTCSDVKGSLENVKIIIMSRRCLGSRKDDDPLEKSAISGEGVELEVRKFCYWGLC
jgi:hypothetical protein